MKPRVTGASAFVKGRWRVRQTRFSARRRGHERWPFHHSGQSFVEIQRTATKPRQSLFPVLSTRDPPARAIPPPILELRPAHGTPPSLRAAVAEASSGWWERRARAHEADMDTNAGSFVAVRRLAGSDRAAGAVAFHHSSSG